MTSQPTSKKIRARYTIIVIDYLTIWVEVELVKDCSAKIATWFLFEKIVTRLGCPKVLMSDQGTQFLNKTISTPKKEFQIYHQKSTPYRSQANSIVKAFNKILGNMLTKLCNVTRDDWDLRILIVLWDYKTIYNKLTGKTPFRLVYGQEAIMPMEFLIPCLCIVAMTKLTNSGVVE